MAIREVFKNGIRSYTIDVCVRISKPVHVKIQRRKTGFESFKAATAAQKKLLHEATLEAHEKANRGLLWSELIDQWELSLRHHGKIIQSTTVQDYIGTLRLYTQPWENKPAHGVYPTDVKSVLRFMDQEGKSRSRQKCLKNAINGMFAWANDEGIIPSHIRSPAYGIKLRESKTEKPPEILTINQLKKLLELAIETKHPWRHVWSFAALTGMRSGELFALEWKDVEWEGRKINVSKSYNGRLKITKTTKAGYWRDIPINDDLLLLLQELRSLRGQETHVLPRLPRWQNGEAARILRTFCVGHGLPSIRLHTLRACFATQLIKNKVAPAQVMKVGGWKELKVMQRYIRLAGIEIDGATDSLKILPERDVMAQVVPLFNGGTALNFEPNAQRVPDMEDK